MHNELAKCGDVSDASVGRNAIHNETVGVNGYYTVQCHDKDGNLKWEDGFPNQVVQVGKQLMLNTLLTGSSYTVVGPYMGLVATSSPTFSPTDTMTSHSGWTEFVNYTYSGSAVRGTAAFSASTGNNSTTSGSNVVTSSLSSSLVFTITSTGGTVSGCFIVTGTGAVNTQSSTAGTLYSAGAFTGGTKTTSSGDTLTVSYSTTATS
jgi:hypothetical protein